MMISSDAILFLCTFLSVTVLAALALWWGFGRDREVGRRLDDLKGPHDAALRSRFQRSRRSAQDTVSSSLASFGSRLLPGSSSSRVELIERFMHAGIYSSAGPSIYSGVRLALGIGIPIGATLAGVVGQFEPSLAVGIGSACGLFGIVGTSVWLRTKVRQRQRQLRRSLPDFLDLMGTCLQAGQSFESALARVTAELQAAHPALTIELSIVQREMALGSPASRALRSFAERSGLESIRQMATLIDQSQKFGASMTESMRIHAEMLRTQRAQQAETLAQKAGVKVLMPTLLFIFPPVLVILVGPAAIDLHEKFVKHEAPATPE